jgi:hypothetical protein
VSGAPALVVLAAGLGTRFGGPKQLVAVGPGGATLMDYAVYDALRVGVERLVFVIRADIKEAFDLVADRYRGRATVVTAVQSSPRGTVDALLVAKEFLPASFLVLNADDFYGRASIEAAAGFLTATKPRTRAMAAVGYRLDRTLSPMGPVNRALLSLNPAGKLASVVEVTSLRKEPGGMILDRDAGGERSYGGDELVSMNLWAFTPAALSLLQPRAKSPLPGRREYLIADAVGEFVVEGSVKVSVLPTESQWYGLTHRNDVDGVTRAIRDLVSRGEYPERLWE